LGAFVVVLAMGCSGSSGTGGSGGSENGGSQNGGATSGGGTGGGTQCACGGCGGAPMCCTPDGAMSYADSCNHACPPGTKVSLGYTCLSPGQCQNFYDCASDEFCDHSITCTDVGDCVKRPTTCPSADAGAEVCDCSGQTRASECEANASGYDVSFSGPCN
jgi:hypothetical protein